MKHDTLHGFRIETPHTPQHRAQLRTVLLHQHTDSSQSLVTRLGRRLAPLQGAFSMKKQLITGAGITTLALVVGATTMFSPLNPHVAAQQAANDGLHYVSRLSSSELAAMKSTLAADPQALLQAASKAGDLTKISRDEFKALVRESKTTVVRHSDDQGNVSGKIETKPGSSAVDSIGTVDPNTVPQTPGTTGEGTSAGTNTDTPPALTEADVKVIDARIESAVKFVKYTNAEGRTVIVAFDSTSKPVFTATVIR